ncbi:protein kinase [Streptomyces viridiviolaceus]|uniref:non-specific serine/threonine protein kinase n=1 Tax=Streptomyces viridiviolaceus TaxID=68282 RepID=A0ABW2DWY1_9ACTN|nr:serine/threonine-protein kinase [Streptomyces viridiviolaceus]
MSRHASSGSPQSGVGRVVAGRYLLLRRLGSGGMGHVWLAHDQRLACEVALKEIVFRDPSEAGPEREARVARARAEARHAAGLRDHPHVVTVHDVLEHEGLPWIVMEYVANAVDLRELVARRGPLAPAEGARIGLAVLDALTAGHERGVLHRDVKPANILLAPDRAGAPYGRVLLADYGIAVQPDTGETRYTLASALLGTAGYLAPERARGGPPTPAADLFSLGCTLYHAVEGRGPFERESHLAEITAVVTEEPRPPLRAGALRPVLQRLLAKDPDLRITAAETEAELAWIITPQTETYTRTGTDPGSQPPWASAPPAPGPHGAEPDSGPAEAEPGSGPLPALPGPRPYSAESGSAPAGADPHPPDPLRDPRASVPPDHRPHSRKPQAPDPSGSPSRGPGPRAFGPGASHATPPAPAGHRRPRLRALRAALAGGLGLILALGGVWYALADRATGGTGAPYGDTVGLAAPLRDGDCVRADWPGGTRFTGTPRLTRVPDCRGEAPDGQVMAFVAVSSAEEARELGPARCEERTREVRARLADVRSLAVVPSEGGFDAAGRRAACLVMGAHGPVHGSLGRYRTSGSVFSDTANMQRRDCLDVRSARDVRLVSCDGRYDEQVLGFTRLASDVAYAEARTAAGRACARDVPPRDYGFDPSLHDSGSRVGENAWKTGTHLVVCTVRSRNGGTMEGNGP